MIRVSAQYRKGAPPTMAHMLTSLVKKMFLMGLLCEDNTRLKIGKILVTGGLCLSQIGVPPS